MFGKVAVLFIIGLVSVTAEKRPESLQKQCQSPTLSNLNQEWVESNTPEKGWYFPIISQSGDSDPGEVLIHRQIPKRNSKDEFCPRLTWKNGVGEFSFFGKTWAIFQCSVNGTYASQACTATDPDSEDSKAENVNIFFTLTDNRSYLMAIRCWEDGDIDWSLLTTENEISAETKELVLAHAESLGFDRRSYNEISYEKC